MSTNLSDQYDFLSPERKPTTRGLCTRWLLSDAFPLFPSFPSTFLKVFFTHVQWNILNLHLTLNHNPRRPHLFSTVFRHPLKAAHGCSSKIAEAANNAAGHQDHRRRIAQLPRLHATKF